MNRNTVISISKGIAIILMVIAHAEAPNWLNKFIFEFHMPLFFITAGYFFSVKYLHDEATFVKKRIKGLYLPFVKWSIIFLALHNLMFKIGILNETYGNAMGGVTHPYTWHQIQQNLWNIFTAMAGYDTFLCGAFWFFRGLFVASILYLILYKVLECSIKSEKWKKAVPYLICVVLLILCGWKSYEKLKIITLVQGGYRDMMGCFFFGCGFIFRQYADSYKNLMKRYGTLIWTTLVFGAIVYSFSFYLPSSMNWQGNFEQFLSLPVPALLGFLMMYNISMLLDRKDNWAKRFLVYTGDHTLNIFIFHIVAYKVVSLIKIWYYGLDIQQIGCHMVVHKHSQEDVFWILYTIAGVGIPLGCTWIGEKWKTKHLSGRTSS